MRALATKTTSVALCSALLCLFACRAPEPVPAPPPPDNSGAPTPEPIEVLYTEDWPGWDLRLLGVATSPPQAWVWKAKRTPAQSALRLDFISPQVSPAHQSWDASPTQAQKILNGYPEFQTINGTFEADLANFARLVRATGPWHHRSRPVPPSVTTDARGTWIVHEGRPTGKQDGDWLYLRDKRGQLIRRLDPGMRAGYSPNISPRADKIAWRACSPKHAGAGRNCNYVLAWSTLQAEPSQIHTLGTLKDPGPPMWSTLDDSLWTVSRTRAQSCLAHVQWAPDAQVTKHHCGQEQKLSLVLSPTGRAGVLSHQEGDTAKPHYVQRWMDLPSTRIFATTSVEGATSAGVLVRDDLMVVPTRDGGVTLLRPTPPYKIHLEAAPGRFVNVEMTQATAEGDLLLLRHDRTSWSFLRVDTELLWSQSTF